MEKAPAFIIRNQAIKNGMNIMLWDGLSKVKDGGVSFQELFLIHE